jgi:hypothetical protein
MPETDRTSALPSPGARVLAFIAILVAGGCGGLIGYGIVDVSCHGDCATPAGIGTVAGALVGAGGVAIIAVLVLRALGEWRTIQNRPPETPSSPSTQR